MTLKCGRLAAAAFIFVLVKMIGGLVLADGEGVGVGESVGVEVEVGDGVGLGDAA